MMNNVKKNASELIGNTPILQVNNLMEKNGIKNASILAKLEYLNPAGSIKDRAALKMIKDAEDKGNLQPGATIIEPTSGNTGIGIASVAASRGYNAVLTLPETMSVERRNLLKAYGAKIVLTDGSKGMKGAIEKAIEIKNETPGSVILGQFDNDSNALAHFETTGPEIYKDLDGKIDILVASVGTGGTITGTGRYLKSVKPDIRIVAVEPATSAVLSGEAPGPHKIQGIGAGFIPKVLDTTIYDEIIKVEDGDAFSTGKEIAHTEGILVGISSGAAMYAAIQLAKKEENKGKNIVVILPDSGDRYLSTPLFAEE